MSNNDMVKQAAIMNAQLLTLQARVICSQTRILSGMYKTRKVTRGITNGVQLTEAELLKDEFDTMDRHIRLMEEVKDWFVEHTF